MITRKYDNKSYLRHKCRFDGCNKKFVRRRDLIRHENVFHLKLGKLFCEYPNCAYFTYDKIFFDKHIAKHDNYSELSSQPIVCDFEGCDKQFGDKQSWINHRNNYHICKVSCSHPDCGFIASSESHLKIHLIKHSDETPFVCEHDGCRKRFKHEYNYKNHLEVHKNKFFKCTFDDCGKTYETSSGLSSHQQSAHIRDTLMVCEWPGCEFSTFSRNSYRGHRRVHSDHKYSCDYPDCGAEYTQTKNSLF